MQTYARTRVDMRFTNKHVLHMRFTNKHVLPRGILPEPVSMNFFKKNTCWPIKARIPVNLQFVSPGNSPCQETTTPNPHGGSQYCLLTCSLSEERKTRKKRCSKLFTLSLIVLSSRFKRLLCVHKIDQHVYYRIT